MWLHCPQAIYDEGRLRLSTEISQTNWFHRHDETHSQLRAPHFLKFLIHTLFHAHGNLLMNLLDRSSSTWISFWFWVIFTLVFLFMFVIIFLVILFFFPINSSKLVSFSSSFSLSSTFSPTFASSTRLGRLSFGFWFSRWLPFRMLLQQSFAKWPFLPQWLHFLGSGQFSAKWPFFSQL